MARQSRGRSAPRSAPAPRAAPAQTRSASTAAVPAPGYNPAASHAPTAPPAAAAASSGQPGMLAQMAATAGSVAIGSTIGHGLSSMLFGGSSSAPTQEAPAPQGAPVQAQSSGLSCDGQARDFTRCLETADPQSCTWFLEQLKSCQAAAAPY